MATKGQMDDIVIVVEKLEENHNLSNFGRMLCVWLRLPEPGMTVETNYRI